MGLPDFIPPMLAKLGREPFDSDEHRFELKWDGTRSLCLVEAATLRLRNRRADDQTPRYPDLGFLASLPDGTALDGEIVILVDGRPAFHGMLEREQARRPDRARAAAIKLPAIYVAFDLLYERGEPLLDLPLAERIERLAPLVSAANDPRLVFSEGVVGPGRAFFESVRERGLEGVIAKRLASRYLPGRRTDAWTKIKPALTAHCVVLGWERDVHGGVKSLVVALEEEGRLRCVGQVGSGLDERTRERLRVELPKRSRLAPLVPCPGVKAEWIDPGLFCTVTYLERTRDGNLRAPVFQGFLDEVGE